METDHHSLLLRLMDKIDQIQSKQDEHVSYSKTKLESIDTQAKLTNGRVKKNETDIQELKNFRTQVKTYGTIGGAILAFISATLSRLI